MNRIHNIYWGQGQKELGVHTRPITLSEHINLLIIVIKRQEAIDFPGKAEKLAEKRAYLAVLKEQEKAQEIVEANKAQVKKLREALSVYAYMTDEYPPEMLENTRADFIEYIAEVKRGQS